MDEEASGDLRRRLREVGAEELAKLVRAHAPKLDPPGVRQLLRNPHITTEIIDLVVFQPRLLSFYEVKRDLALHPRTAQLHALRLIPTLYWRDLMNLGLDTRVRPVVRRAADRRLMERLPSLALGEKIAIARRASAGVLSHLRRDPSTKVIGAMLENPRLTEGLLVPLVYSENVSPPVLRLIAGNRRWGARYGVRLAICRNPHTPAECALSLLCQLRKSDLRVVASDPRLAGAVRKRAQLLLGDRG